MGLPGDVYLADESAARTVMTRAISIAATPEQVWPWLAQLGRGAGWYSYDRADNGGRQSARHVVPWIPEPELGDAAAIGWLRNLDPGRGLTWWMEGEQLAGTRVRMVTDIHLDAGAGGSRLVIRMSGEARGGGAIFVARMFEVVDSIMAIRQLRSIKGRAEAYGTRTSDPACPELGRDQYQLYEAIWASGGGAGEAGRESANRWHQGAVDAGVLPASGLANGRPAQAHDQ